MTRSTTRLLLFTTALTSACANTTETRTDVVVARTPVKLPPREEDWTIRAKHSVTDGVLSMTLTRTEACEETGERVTIETRSATRPAGEAFAVDLSAVSLGYLATQASCEQYLFCTHQVLGLAAMVIGGVATIGDLTKYRSSASRRTEDRRTTASAAVCRETPFFPRVLLVSFDGAAAVAVKADAGGVYRLPWPSRAPYRVMLSVPDSPLRGTFDSPLRGKFER